MLKIQLTASSAKYTLKVELVYFSCWRRAILCTSEFLKKWPFLLSPSTRESIPRRPLPRTRAFLEVFDNSRGESDHGKFCCAAIKIMGKLQKRKGTWEGLTWKANFRSSLDSLCRNYHQKSGQEAAGYKGGVICEYWAYWYLCLPVYYIYGVLIFIAFAVNEKKNNIPTICWPSSELNNKCSHVTNLPEGETQILLQTICNHQILRTIFYFQSAQKWKWILQDH